jgi:hypothetical protein
MSRDLHKEKKSTSFSIIMSFDFVNDLALIDTRRHLTKDLQ